MFSKTILAETCTVKSVIYECKKQGANAKQAKSASCETKTPDFTLPSHKKPHCEAATVLEEITTEKRTSKKPFYLQQYSEKHLIHLFLASLQKYIYFSYK